MRKPVKKSSFRDKISGNTQKQKSSANSFGYFNLPKDVHLFVPEPASRVRLDFIPYEVTDLKHLDRDDDLDIATVGSQWYKHPYKVHRNVGANNDTEVCPSSIAKKCPICEYAQKRAKEGAEKEETTELWAKTRNLYVVVPRGSKKHEETPYIWDISQFLFQNLLNEELEENDEHMIFPDPNEGLTLKLRFETKKMGKNSFEEVARIDFEERDSPIDDDILEKVPNLDEVLKIKTYEELHAKFFEMEDELDGGKLTETEDEKPERQRKTTRQEVKKEEDEEDEKPTRRQAEKTVEKPVKKEKELPTEGFDWDSLLDMNQTALEKLVKGYSLDIDISDYDDSVTDLRKAIAIEMNIEIPKATKKPTPKEEPEERPVRNTRKESNDDECPHSHKFAVDTDKFDDCDTCKIWEKCADKRDELKKKK